MGKYIDFALADRYYKEFALHTQRFILHPERLGALPDDPPLEWDSVQFLPGNDALVVRERGVYALIVSAAEGANAPRHGYVLYFGSTGQRARSRTLRHRYKDYVGEQKRPKRPAIYALLNKWRDCLYFHFAPIADQLVDVESVEERLNDSFIPPYSTLDFSAELRTAKGMWEKL